LTQDEIVARTRAAGFDAEAISDPEKALRGFAGIGQYVASG